MRKYIHILSTALLMVYGAVTLVIVPLHRHTVGNNISSKQLPSAVAQLDGKINIHAPAGDCEVCAFISAGTLIYPSFILQHSFIQINNAAVGQLTVAPLGLFEDLSFRGPPHKLS